MPAFDKLIWSKFWGLLIFIVILNGCANPTTVHIYGKYYQASQLQPLVATLQDNDFQVEINELDVPGSVSENTVLYSLMIDDSTKVGKVQSLVNQAGFTVNQLLPLTRANHWYTKNSLALILFPEDPADTGHVFRQDLDNHYLSKGCSAELILELNTDGSYFIKGQIPNYQWTAEDKEVLSGTWLYRQFPYVELRTKTHNDKYTYFMYLEISKRFEQDQISAIELLNLKPVQYYQVMGGCEFEFGNRVSG